MGKGKKVTIGYKYFMGIHMIMTQVPVDAFKRIDVGRKTAWSGNVTSSQQIYINAPNLFGGEKKEGGVQGYVDLEFGEPTQNRNDYLQSVLGSVIPAFRGVTGVVLRKCYITAMTPYPKPWAFLLSRIPAKTWQPLYADVGGSANPIHIIYECLTSADWGMGHPASGIGSSFAIAAQKCHTEGLGLSMTLSSQDTVESFIQLVLGHANGVLYTDPSTGNFEIKLLRDDYSVSGLKVFNQDNIVKLESFERPTPAEMVNEIVVVYRPKGTSTDDSVVVQDLASIQSQGGTISQTKQYPGIDNAANASRVALRDLRQLSTPLAKLSFSVNRDGWDLTVGSVISFSWPPLGISSIVLRVLKLDFGDTSTGYINIEAAEDVFGLPAATYLATTNNLWVEPTETPQAITNRVMFEAPYWEVMRSVSEADAAYLDAATAFVAVVASSPQETSFEYDMYSKVGSVVAFTEADSEVYCPMLVTLNALSKTTTSITYGTILGDDYDIVIGGYGLIDNEIVRIVSVAVGTVVIARGCLDTVPENHSIGSKLYFVSDNLASDPEEYVVGDGVYVKLLSKTPSQTLDLATASIDFLTMTGRFNKPYAPGQFRINGTSYPTIVNLTATVSWAHRDRTLQLATVIDTENASIGPEVGTTYTIRAYRESNGTLLQTITGLTGTSVLLGIPSGTYDVRVELNSVRGGVESLQKHSHIFTFVNPTSKRLTEAGDLRILESLDYRTVE